ncbi:MAG: hypothetical protein QOH71_1667 [Blastocatellia bacterium]|nr:hypothetical protein [Blastocatellia bacterium]
MMQLKSVNFLRVFPLFHWEAMFTTDLSSRLFMTVWLLFWQPFSALDQLIVFRSTPGSSQLDN